MNFLKWTLYHKIKFPNKLSLNSLFKFKAVSQLIKELINSIVFILAKSHILVSKPWKTVILSKICTGDSEMSIRVPHSEPQQCHSLSSEPDCLQRKISVLNICLLFMQRKAILAHPCPGKTFQLRKMTLRSDFLLLLFIRVSANRGCQKEGRDGYCAKSVLEGKETSPVEKCSRR